MTDLSEIEIINQLEAWHKEGVLSRDNNSPNRYKANTLAYYMHVQGWLQRDLQLGLAVYSSAYQKQQFASGSMTMQDLENWVRTTDNKKSAAVALNAKS